MKPLCSGINASTNAGSNARTSPDLPDQQKQLTGRSRLTNHWQVLEAVRSARHSTELAGVPYERKATMKR
jgi:hypothetical protein